MIRRLILIEGGAEPSARLSTELEARGIFVECLPGATVEDLRRVQPDAVSLDWELPVGSGSGLCTKIKRDSVLSRVFVVLTGPDARVLQAHSLSRYPADAYLQKPYSPEQLCEVLSRDDAAPPAGEPTAADDAGPDWPGDELATKLEAFSRPLEEAAPVRGTPEQRLSWLRQQVRHLEHQNRELIAFGHELLERGGRLGRGVERATQAHDEIGRQLEQARSNEDQVRKEFQRYEAEVHRLVRSKQDEEKQLKDRLAELTTGQRQSDDALERERKERANDARRRKILEQELGELEERAQEAERWQRELLEARESRQQQARRLETVESIAAERADQVRSLQDTVADLNLRLQRSEAEAEARTDELRHRLDGASALVDDMQREVARLQQALDQVTADRDRVREHEAERRRALTTRLTAVLAPALDAPSSDSDG